MQMTPYLNFTGQCREAFDQYAEVLNGEIVERFTYGESPMCDEMPPESHDQIMHTLLVADGAALMGADGPTPDGGTGHGMWVALNVDTAEEAERIFEAFSEGADIEMPMEKTFWAERFGMLVDRFGTAWIINGNLQEDTEKEGTES
ncbi:MAG: VOC family protein [Gemmatimonadota bacterium]